MRRAQLEKFQRVSSKDFEPFNSQHKAAQGFKRARLICIHSAQAYGNNCALGIT